MGTTTSISFVRHGQVHNPQDLFYGRLDGFPISDLGHQQASAIRDYFSDSTITALFSSPMLRARQTAEIILEVHAETKMIIDKLLNETKSPYDGKPSSEVRAVDWDIYTGADTRFEQPQDVLHRALDFVRMARREYSGEQIIAVTHRDLIVFLYLWYKDRPITATEKTLIQKDFIVPGSISTFIFTSVQANGKPEFSYVNPSY